jgi:hypothetical protein
VNLHRIRAYVVLASVSVLGMACSAKQQGHQAAPPHAVASSTPLNQSGASNATVFGRITDEDWYMVATGAPGMKPLVIWVPSKSACDTSASEFNLKSVDPQRPGEPAKAWCAQGRDLLARNKVK